MNDYAVYSDISYSDRTHSMHYAAIVTCSGTVVDEWTGTIEGCGKRTSIGEVTASSFAAARVPSGEKLVVFTDIADLVDLFKKLHIAEARGQFRHAINCLMRELKRMKSAEVRLVCRRNKFYIQCHNAAHREGYPGRYDTWQYWRSKKNAKPKRATYSIAPVLHTALNRSLLQFPT